MIGHEIFENICALKEQFRTFFQQRKQMSALENYSHIKQLTHVEKEVFDALRYCMKGSFLQEEDAEWISQKLKRLEINYLDWAHRTKWIKSQIGDAIVNRKPKIIQTTFFDLMPKQQKIYVPTHLIVEKSNTSRSTRI